MDAAMVERIVASLNNSTGRKCLTSTGEGIKEPINDMGETFLHWAAFNGDSDAVLPLPSRRITSWQKGLRLTKAALLPLEE